MKYLFFILLSGCGIQKSMDGIREQMQTMGASVQGMSDYLKETKESLKYTKGAIKQQGVALMLKEIVDPQNSTFVSPGSTTPTSMIPSGKFLAEQMSAEEIVGIFYLWITEINEGQIDPLTEDNKNKADKVKWSKFTALQVIAGFIPEETLSEIIKKGDGKYAGAVDNVLLLRHVFISTYVLELGILAKTKITQAEYGTGVEAIQALKFIESQSSAANAALEIHGFYDSGGLGLNQTIKPGQEEWKKYQERLDGIPK